ncbi:MAG TPA: hypothetical protein VK915_14645 [Gaiellaceae bacterium]|nr:hypothetical protein [Gaiellaceae bacterium]
MSRWTRLGAALGVVVVAVVLFVVLRPDGEDEEAEPTPAAQTGDATTEEATTDESTEDETTEAEPTTTEPTGPPPPTLVNLAFRNGEPVGGIKRPEISKGDRVVLTVRSDVADHIHLHGYDLLADVAPGQPARIRFRANVAGVFELELEDRAVLLAELEVR